MNRQSHAGNGRISPPSSVGFRGHAGTSALHASLTGSIGSVLGGLHPAADANNGGAGYGGPPQNLAEYGHYPGAVEAGSAAMSYGSVSIPHPAMRAGMGPQSFSGMSYDGVNAQVEAEFGYALQRPGVVPSTHELAGSYSSVGQQHSVPSVAFSPHHHHQSHGVASRSLPGGVAHLGYNGRNTSQVPQMNTRRVSRNRYSLGHVPMSPMSQSYNMHQAPTSIREDSTDYQLGGGDTSSVASGASLLAQQLEEQAAIARDALRVSDTSFANMDQAHRQQQQTHPAYMPQQAPMYTGAQAPAGYYTTYIGANGMPVVTSNMEQQRQFSAGNSGPGFHQGNFSDQHQVPMHGMHQQQQHHTRPPISLQHGGGGGGVGYAPAYLRQQQQPSFEELEHARQTGLRLPPGAHYNRGLSM